jgi:predicted nucleic acid-binding protein
VYLADTSAWNRSTRTIDKWEAMVETNELAVCPPVVLELLYSARSRTEYRSLAFELSGRPELPLSPRAAATAARTQARLAETSQHRGPTPIDLLVAAIADVHGATLLHYDRHFDAIARVTGQPMEWLAPRGTLT